MPEILHYSAFSHLNILSHFMLLIGVLGPSISIFDYRLKREVEINLPVIFSQNDASVMHWLWVNYFIQICNTIMLFYFEELISVKVHCAIICSIILIN